MALRVAHAVLFELGLLIVLMPFIAWYLGVSLMQALVMDISFALFYLVYAFFFNLAYDRIFPLPEWQEEAKACRAKMLQPEADDRTRAEKFSSSILILQIRIP
jgi:uncharacterized membrane protein